MFVPTVGDKTVNFVGHVQLTNLNAHVLLLLFVFSEQN